MTTRKKRLRHVDVVRLVDEARLALIVLLDIQAETRKQEFNYAFGNYTIRNLKKALKPFEDVF